MHNCKTISTTVFALLISHGLFSQTEEIFAKSHSGKFTPKSYFSDGLGMPYIPFIIDTIIIIDTMSIEIGHGSVHEYEHKRDTFYNHYLYNKPQVTPKELKEYFPDAKIIFGEPNKNTTRVKQSGGSLNFNLKWHWMYMTLLLVSFRKIYLLK
jgi:hypothetical protein